MGCAFKGDAQRFLSGLAVPESPLVVSGERSSAITVCRTRRSAVAARIEAGTGKGRQQQRHNSTRTVCVFVSSSSFAPKVANVMRCYSRDMTYRGGGPRET